jgi:CheY-like chemotaxis protein
LAGNAIKFTAKGEVVVSLRVIALDAATVTIEFAVRDTGIGIAPENQERIFSGFTQAEASTTRRFGGTGLGLVISQRLIAMMGGEIMLSSRLGEGSRFHYRITLPLAAEADSEEPLESRFDPALSAARRALVIDDNPSAREILQRMCQSLGWQVDVADGGESALALLREQAAAGVTYQMALVDWEMPGLDGWQTSRAIRDLGAAGENLVLVMVTAHGAEMLAQRSEAEQALLDGYVVKPITASMLIDAVAGARGGSSGSCPSRLPSGAAGSRLTGMRLLLVEDNPTNQQVAQELLEGEGALVQVANHGLEAVGAVTEAAKPFDVVLMDLQMPVMDGFEATRRIRADATRQGLPIVAMTANAMASDRDECLAAGMNDHVAKPFDLDRLVAVLRKQAGWPELNAQAAAAVDPAVPAAVAEAAAAAGVEIQAALLRMGGHRKLYLDALRAVTRDLAELPSKLQSLLAQEDVADARRLLHTLKGVAATLGASTLSIEAAKAEQQLTLDTTPAEQAGIADRAGAAIMAARPGLTALLEALIAADQPRPAPGSAPSSAIDAQALQKALQSMAAQLRDADMAATDTMEQLQRQFGAQLGQQLQPLEDAVAELQFDRALRLCNELSRSLQA